ncbi:MAG: zinc-ribbon domain-containing protein [Armatimonadia bacterium]|nr:zinc-ribbon domain-containing protein [Armatimonadia bacterium]
MFCPECDREVADDAKFCPGCGADLKEGAEESAPDATEDEPAAAATPPPPATPAEPGPAVPSEPPPPTATAETAREGAAEAMAEEGPAAETDEEPAYQPYEPPQPTPSADQPTPQPTASSAPTPAPPPGPSEMPADQQPQQAPPGQQPPPPTQGAAPAGQAPEEKKGTNWASICLIGCGIMLLLAIIGGVGLYLVGRSAVEKAQELEVPSTMTNEIDIWEPGEGPTDGGTEEGAGEGGPEIREPGDEGVDGEDLGDVIGRLGETVEGIGEAMSAGNIEGFDPSEVDSQMLPTFYGFMVALAQDNPQGMYQWMSPDMKQHWSPEDNWEVAPQIEHLGYTLKQRLNTGDGVERFTIEEQIRDNQDNTESTISWEIHFEKIDGQWYVTYFE